MYNVKKNTKIIADNTVKALLTDMGINLCRKNITNCICNCIPNPAGKIAVKGVGVVAYYVACAYFTKEESYNIGEAIADMYCGKTDVEQEALKKLFETLKNNEVQEDED